jgi:formylglycine-generating enzyme required for sulfatase activity
MKKTLLVILVTLVSACTGTVLDRSIPSDYDNIFDGDIELEEYIDSESVDSAEYDGDAESYDEMLDSDSDGVEIDTTEFVDSIEIDGDILEDSTEYADYTDCAESDFDTETDIDTGPRQLKWISISGAMFWMGETPWEIDHYGNYLDEQPYHQVWLKSFDMTETEITQHQYRELTGKSPSYHVACDDCPVENLSKEDAAYFCTLIGGRLPSESEWEYAARAGSDEYCYCSDYCSDECIYDYAWTATHHDDYNTTLKVGLLLPNSFGLYDTIGNVSEWVADCYHSTYEGAPTDGSAWTTDCYFDNVHRGCSIECSEHELRIANRKWRTYPEKDTGFRCARDKS